MTTVRKALLKYLLGEVMYQDVPMQHTLKFDPPLHSCRRQENLGPITDIEVIETLERRGADKDWARRSSLASERQVQLLFLFSQRS